MSISPSSYGNRLGDYNSRPPGLQATQSQQFGATAAPAVGTASAASTTAKSDSPDHGGFFDGLLNGAKKLGSYIANPKNWLVIGGITLLCMACPAVGLGLCGLGVVMGGSSIVKGLSSGNMEEVGEGVFDTGLSAVGAYGSFHAVKAGQAASAASESESAVTMQSAGKVSETGDMVNGVAKHGWTVVNNGSSAETLTDVMA